MIIVINGPGCPVLAPSIGSRMPCPPRATLYPPSVFENASEVFAVEPFWLRHPSSAEAAACPGWLPPDLHPHLTVLTSDATLPTCGALGYRTELLRNRIMGSADVSGFLRRPPACPADRIIMVGRYVDLSEQDMITLRNRHGYILCGTYPSFGGGIPRFQPGGPLYWQVEDDGTCTPGPVVEAPDGLSILADTPEKLAEQVFRHSPGTFRIISTAADLPDIRTEIGRGVLELSADPEFAEAAMKDAAELSTRHIEALPG